MQKHELEVGALVVDGMMIGEYDETIDGGAEDGAGAGNRILTLDLGWCRLAGVHVIVRGDATKPRSRRVVVDTT